MISLLICSLVPFLPGISDQFIFDDVPAILENKVSAVIVTGLWIRAKVTYKYRKKLRIFMFWSSGCSFVRAERLLL
jgi:hypothetical protein